ncbi:unnamed protein product [Phytomonas sp. EM1]|nr:unnamed protein product [Phytomonas sp. EM1]|eukprot:CCW61679.1 unnamed protein product [Phytomonas sp. isolate EM1]
MLLAYLYRLHGVEGGLMGSFLATQIRAIGGLCEVLSSTTTGEELPVRRALAGVAAALTALRTCGGKLLKEAPQEVERAVREGKNGLARLKEASPAFSLVRFGVLLEAMGEIAAGRLRKGRRSVTEAEAPVEAMLDDLCEILVQASSSSSSTGGAFAKRTQRRIIETACTLSGVSWEFLLRSDKPPRWYATAASPPSDDEDVEKGKGGSRENSPSSASSTSSEEGEWERKQASIRKLRHEEKAIAGQRFNTEHKREIFKAVASATDDLECFNLLMHRDPSYSRFHDVCVILIQCCCQETKYNPYYASVLERFCNSKSACQRKLQFALWDRFKGIRIEPVDVATYLNLACFVTTLLEHGVFTLSVLRGLDLENTNKTIGLFTRVLLLRMLVQLPPKRLTELFFGGDGFRVHDLNTDTATFRESLRKFMERYFVDEAMMNRWTPAFYDVVAAGTSLDVHPVSKTPMQDERVGVSQPGNKSQDLESVDTTQKLREFTKRIRVAYKALKHGIS